MQKKKVVIGLHYILSLTDVKRVGVKENVFCSCTKTILLERIQ